MKRNQTKAYEKVTKPKLKLNQSKTETKLHLLETPEVITDPNSTIKTLERQSMSTLEKQSISMNRFGTALKTTT